MAFLEKVDELNIRQRLLVLGVIIGLLLAVFYYYVYTPNKNARATLETKLSVLQTDLQSLRAIAAKLPEFKAEIKRLQVQLDESLKQLPQEKEIPTLLENISKAGTESGLQFELFKPGAETKKDIYAEVPVDITVKGPFQNIVLFLDKVAHFPRIVNISTFVFSNPKEDGGYVFITGSGRATTYRYLEKT